MNWNINVPSAAWWEEFTDEERRDLEAWLAEVNKFPDDRPSGIQEDEPRRDPDAPL